MNSLKNLIDKYNFKVNSHRHIGNVRIIDTDKGTYVVKRKQKADKKEIFRYLKAKQFGYYLDLENDYDDEYEMYPYIEDTKIKGAGKGTDLIYIMSMLHNKTTFYEKVVLDDTKKFYEEQSKYLEYIRSYYDNILWLIETSPFASPSNYLLLRNISYIYNSLEACTYYLKEWYELVKDKDSKRVCVTHNNIDESHLLIDEASYLISWDNSKIDSPIYDFYNFYKKNYYKYDCKTLYNLYNTKYELLKEEKYLLFALILIPEKLELVESEIENTKNCHHFLKYLFYALNFVSEYKPNNANSKHN